MTTQEALIRGNNLVAAAITGLAGFAFFPEFFLEDQVRFKIDDGLTFLIGLFSIYWYKKGKNRFVRSAVPVALVGLDGLLKLMAIFLEIKDKEDVGDDFGGIVLFVLATVFTFWLYRRSTNAGGTPA